MEAKLAALRGETKHNLLEIRNRFQKTLPLLDRLAEDVKSEVSSLLNGAICELRAAHQDLRNIVAEDSCALHEENNSDCDELLENSEDGDLLSKSFSEDEPSFFRDTVRRICDRLDEVYRNDTNTKCADTNCDLDYVAALINQGANKDALKVIIKNSRNIDDVFKLSAEALDRANGVNPRITEKLKLIDYTGMCVKYATTQNKSITDFVDNVLYEALLDGKICPSDFSDSYVSLEQVETELDEDRETVNENAKRFIRLLTKTLIPLTSVILKISAVITLTVFCVTPVTAGLLCASALTLDTLNEFMKSRMVLDMFETFMCATSSGECFNDVLSNRYVTRITEALLHEAVIGTITVCHSFSRGHFFKK